jgi:hypothetical protein
VSAIDTEAVDTLKALDPNSPIREPDVDWSCSHACFCQRLTHAWQQQHRGSINRFAAFQFYCTARGLAPRKRRRGRRREVSVIRRLGA